MKNVNYKKSNGTTGHISINDNEEIIVVDKDQAQELNTNEEPLLNPGLVGNANNDPDVEADPEIVDEILNRNEEDELPMPITGVKFE